MKARRFSKLIETDLDKLFASEAAPSIASSDPLDEILEEEERMLAKELKLARAKKLKAQMEAEMKKIMKEVEGDSESSPAELELAKTLANMKPEEASKVLAYYSMLKSAGKSDSAFLFPIAMMMASPEKSRESDIASIILQKVLESKNIDPVATIKALKEVTAPQQDPVDQLTKTIRLLKDLGIIREEKEEKVEAREEQPERPMVAMPDPRVLIEIERMRDERERWLKEMEMRMKVFEKLLEAKKEEAQMKFALEQMRLKKEAERGSTIDMLIDAIAKGASRAVSEVIEEEEQSQDVVYMKCPVCEKEGVETIVAIPEPDKPRVVTCPRGHQLKWVPEGGGNVQAEAGEGKEGD